MYLDFSSQERLFESALAFSTDKYRVVKCYQNARFIIMFILADDWNDVFSIDKQKVMRNNIAINKKELETWITQTSWR